MNEFIRNHPGVVGFGASFLYFDLIVRKNKPVTDNNNNNNNKEHLERFTQKYQSVYKGEQQ